MGQAKRTAKQVRAAERQKQALELRLAGMGYQQIADEVGWKNPSSAYRACKAALAAIPKDAAKDLRDQQMAILDNLQLAQMNAANEGDTKSALAVLSIVQERAKMLGLYELTDSSEQQRELREEMITLIKSMDAALGKDDGYGSEYRDEAGLGLQDDAGPQPGEEPASL